MSEKVTADWIREQASAIPAHYAGHGLAMRAADALEAAERRAREAERRLSDVADLVRDYAEDDGADPIVGKVREALECGDESEREAKQYLAVLERAQVALGVRCIDNPDKLGCMDLIFDVPEECKRLRARLDAAEGVVAEMQAIRDRLSPRAREALARWERGEG